MERKKGCSIFFADVYNLLFLENAITIRWLGYKKVKNGKSECYFVHGHRRF